jgi:hypothetical protein
MRDAGVGIYRAAFREDQVVDSTGAYTRWALLDNLVLQAGARGITLLPIVMRMTPSYEYRPPKSDAERAALATFAGEAARRYGPNGTFWSDPASVWSTQCAACVQRPIRAWEIWNEENAAPYWDVPNPAEYAAMLVAVRAGLRAADPEARIVLGGLADVQGDPARGESAPLTFLRGVIAAAGPNSFDAVAMHAYHPDPAVAAQRVRAVAQTLKALGGQQRNGAPRHQVWLTEFGRSTAAGGAAAERMQAAWLGTFLNTVLLNREAWNLGPLVAYAMRDAPVPSESYHLLGLRRTNNDDTDAGAKPAWNALVAAASSGATVALPALR